MSPTAKIRKNILEILSRFRNELSKDYNIGQYNTIDNIMVMIKPVIGYPFCLPKPFFVVN